MRCARASNAGTSGSFFAAAFFAEVLRPRTLDAFAFFSANSNPLFPGETAEIAYRLSQMPHKRARRAAPKRKPLATVFA